MKTKKRNSPRTEPWGISAFRGQRDEVELAKSKGKHTQFWTEKFLTGTLQALHILFVAGCENNLLGNVHSDLGVIYIISNGLFDNFIWFLRKLNVICYLKKYQGKGLQAHKGELD